MNPVPRVVVARTESQVHLDYRETSEHRDSKDSQASKVSREMKVMPVTQVRMAHRVASVRLATRELPDHRDQRVTVDPTVRMVARALKENVAQKEISEPRELRGMKEGVDLLDSRDYKEPRVPVVRQERLADRVDKVLRDSWVLRVLSENRVPLVLKALLAPLDLPETGDTVETKAHRESVDQ